MFDLFKRKQTTLPTVLPILYERDYRVETALRNMGIAVARCNGAMGIIKRNYGFTADFYQLQFNRDYMRRMLGHI